MTQSLRAPLLRATLLAGTALAVFTPLASGAFLWGAGLWDAYPYQWWCAWWFYLLYAREDPIVAQWLLVSGLPAAVLPLAIAGIIAVRRWQRRRTIRPGWLGNRLRPVERGVSDNHGHAQWRTMADAKRLFPGPHPTWGGIVVGEAYRVDQDRSVAGIPFDPRDKRTWGMGGKAPLLIDPCTQGSGHSLVFAGTGAFKTTSAVSTVLTWVGSSVVMDPSTELGPMLHSAMCRQGKEVAHIGTPGPEHHRATGFNALSWIDVAHPDAEQHVHSVVGWIYEEASGANTRREDPFFSQMGRNLVTCLLAHLVWSDLAEVEITLTTLADGLAMPERDMISNLKGIAKLSNSPLARRLAATLSNNAAAETFSGVFLNAVKGVGWLFTSSHADIVSRGEFDPALLVQTPTTVFLNIPLRTLETTPAIARVLVGALLNIVYMAEGKTYGKILFLIDEAARLGALKALETARDTGRKYGVVLHMLYQSVGQMYGVWNREGETAWIDAASWIGYASVRAAGAGRELSAALGTYGVLAYSEGDNRGRQRSSPLSFSSLSRGTNSNVHETARSLMGASELQQDLREDEIIIVPAQGQPIRAGRAIFFRRKEFAAVVDGNRFSQREVING